MDKSYTENIPQEVLDEYIRDLRNPSEEDQRSGHQKAPQRRKAKHGPSDISGGDAENGSQFSTSAEEIFRGVAKGGMKGVDDDTFSTFSLLNGGRPRRGPPSMANFYSQESPRPSTPVPTAHSNHHSSDPEIKPSGSSLGEVFDLTVPENRLLNKSAAQPLSKHVDLPRQFDFAEKRRPTSTVMGVTSGETGRPKSQQSGTDSRYIQIYSVRNRNDIHAGHSTHLRRQGGEYSVVKDPDRDTDGGPVPEQSDGSYSEDDLSIRRSNGAYFGRSRSHRLKKNATETRHSPEPYGRRTGDANIARVYTKRPTPVDGASNYGSDDGLESVQRIRTSKAARNSTSRPSPEPRIIRSATTGARRTRRSGDEIPPRALKIELAPKIKNLDNAHDQVQTLWSYFKEVLKPVCDSFIARLPDLHDSKKREFEYKVLSELMVTQVLLQADSIEPGDDETTRSSRRRLIKEVQAGLNVLDAHVGSLSLPQIL